ncbi:class I SAM-dependent methyltransferase [Fodinicola acaciae]|uniref:class I SAM-dependent methyltransferase n=1 Tax=Fodinicola acaciae TaxID=2681555 RepID=UPI0013D6DB47|nr:class I SAM-dependent methyltransferase [Fodinicola acaciae]
MTSTAQEYWDDFYREPPAWSGEPNPLLVRETADLAPGGALDLGCGEGGDAIWLAGQGWRVTAVDVSETVLRRAAVRAAGADIDWQRHDLSRSFPAGSYDLVSAQFLHSPVAADGERDDILRGAAKAVAPGGRLLVAGHAGWPSWLENPPFDYHFPTTAEVLALIPGDWQVETDETIVRELTGPDGRQGTRKDNVLRVRHRVRARR